jgi:hypothetical protein
LAYHFEIYLHFISRTKKGERKKNAFVGHLERLCRERRKASEICGGIEENWSTVRNVIFRLPDLLSPLKKVSGAFFGLPVVIA